MNNEKLFIKRKKEIYKPGIIMISFILTNLLKG